VAGHALPPTGYLFALRTRLDSEIVLVRDRLPTSIVSFPSCSTALRGATAVPSASPISDETGHFYGDGFAGRRPDVPVGSRPRGLPNAPPMLQIRSRACQARHLEPRRRRRYTPTTPLAGSSASARIELSTDPQSSVIQDIIPRIAMCVRNVDVRVSCSSHYDAQLAAFFIDPQAK
jgi:hypothetical protein